MTDYTIANEYTLPSNGLVYSQTVEPTFKIRSMTTQDEMKRLNHSANPYKAMSEIIDDCIISGLGISAYDLCLPDYQFVLHKLRIVTYGSIYKMTTSCPYCGYRDDSPLDLESLKLVEFDKDLFDKYRTFTLPVTQKEIKLKIQTPRILDNITKKTKDEKNKVGQSSTTDSSLLYTLEGMIDTIDGTKHVEFKTLEFLRTLPMMDTNHIIRASQKLNSLFGLESGLSHVCPSCGLDYTTNFRTTSEFFGPSID